MIELPPATAAEIWGDLAPFVARALAYDVHQSVTVEEVGELVAEGRSRVLVATDGEELLSATVIQGYIDNRGRRMIHVLGTAADKAPGDVWLPALIDELRRIARDEDAAGVTMIGRPGWARKLVKYGWRTKQVAMEIAPHGWEKQTEIERHEREPERELRAQSERSTFAGHDGHLH